MTAPATIGDALTAIVGPQHVAGGEAAAHQAVDGEAPRWVVAPGTVGEVSRCLGVAADGGLAVAPSGLGARLGWGARPRRLDLVLSLRRLDRVLAYEPADLTISVQAGLSLSALNAHLRPHRQFLPLDPPRIDASTVGGLIATATAGPYRARYGTMRDLVLGVTVAQADGTLARGGGRVVKNATGYDMPKLHVGGLGTLGVVLEAHLRLHPLPAEEATRVFGFTSAEAALAAAVAVRDTAVVLSRLELVDAATLEAFGASAPPAAVLAATLGGVPEAVRAQCAEVEEICGRTGGVVWSVAAAGEWWAAISGATWPPEDTPSLTLRIGTRPGDVVKALRLLEAAAKASDLAVRATAELANGVLHPVLTGAGVTRVAGFLSRLRECLRPLEGTCVVEHAPPSVKGSIDVWGEVGPALAVMRRLKAELDPGDVLNPGRFVGGI